MALANFIDRAATSASQVLGEFKLEPFLRQLKLNVVGIGFDRGAAESPEGRATLDLAIRLLARLYPTLAIVVAGDCEADHAAGLEATAKAINPEIDIVRDMALATVALVVGSSSIPFPCPIFYLGSDGWRTRLSTAGPIGSGATGNPVGAGAAACFGAANVFRTIFAAQLVEGHRDDEINLSMLTFTTPQRVNAVDDNIPVDIGSTHLVGAGAIGNGFLWAAGFWADLRGELHVVDHEPLDLGNLQRYVLAEQGGIGTVKVELAAAHMAATGVSTIPHLADWRNYVTDRADWRFDRVAVALDTARDRIAVQGSLPRRIFNSWTQETDLGVSRHGFGDGPCLACLYMPAGKVKDQDEIVAEELGLPDARLEIRTLLQQRTPVDSAFVARVATALAVPFEALSPFIGQPVTSFHQGAICGGLVMRLTGGTAKVKAVVPLAFQSALAGIMLAAEVVKHAMGAEPAPTASTRINLLRPLGQYLNDPKGRDGSGRCLCADQDFLDAYAAKYSDAPTA